jgi:uncharacterized membrane protein
MNTREKIELKINWRSEIVGLFLIAAMFLLAAAVWNTMPDSIPVHFGLDGQPDRYGGKFEGLLSMPLTAAGLYLLFFFLPRIDPRGERYARFAGAYTIIRTAVIALLAAVQVVIILQTRGVAIDVSTIVALLIGLLFMVLGNYMGKIRPNWFVGIRTPWTLSSEESWNKTHRLGGKVFVVMGFVIAAASLFQKPWILLGSIGLLLIATVVLAVYSYLIWKSDPAAKKNFKG